VTGAAVHGARASAPRAGEHDADRETPILELRDVRMVYRSRVSLMRQVDVPAVDGVSLAVGPGTTTCILGETGSGKSTIGRLLLGLVEPTAGEVRFRGRSLASLGREARREYRRSVQMVFQSPISSFNPMLTIGASIRDALRYAPPERRRDPHGETARLLDQVGLPAAFADRYPNEVSGGELQRASIARALATDPAVIFLDEPASALDVSVRGQVFNLLLDLQRDRGLGYVIVTHELSSARALGDRIVVLYLGRVVEDAPREAFFDAPAHPYAAALMAAAAIERGERHGPTVAGDPPSVTDPPPGCAFHTRCWLYRELGEPERCRTDEPMLASAAGGHLAACHFRDERAPGGHATTPGAPPITEAQEGA
jgi:oligopeptide/dipeptide ABC transporter ATP-binding protein